MLESTKAIALHIRPWSKTSHMVTWLTPECGKLVTSVKGACRPKSAFLGQYDLFYTCDLIYYDHDREGAHALRECTPLHLREGLRQSWRRTAAAAYLADLTARVIQPKQDASPIFDLLEGCLDRLSDDREPFPLRQLVLRYEVGLLRHLGVLPDLSICPHCPPSENAPLRFSLSAGRFVCRHRPPTRAEEATLPVHRGVRDLFLSLLYPTDSVPALSACDGESAISTNLVFGLSRFLGMFILFHLDVPSAVRRVALEMMDTTPAQKTALLETRTL